ncbi:MAG: hypothetical protein KIS94_04950 [Chitinophagales bacterium]|nr:hypothetical protein [Chitinophagales bacterium]
MIHRFSYLLALFTVSFIAYSFSNEKEKPLQEKNGLKLYEMKGSPEFPEAGIKLVSTPPATPGKATFQFEVSDFKLGIQTTDAEQKLCANSSKGQHIHFIMDNQPYFASYESSVEWDVKNGHHVLLAFLSRSYHESVKTTKAFVLKEFRVGEDAKDNFDETAPHLFYSRPKGEYIGDSEVQRLMIDFYLLNCTLSEKGYKVRATVNGTEFTLTKWAPYYIEGLPLGDVKVKLELLDKKGNLVQSPFNGAERTVSLKTEPFKK